MSLYSHSQHAQIHSSVEAFLKANPGGRFRVTDIIPQVAKECGLHPSNTTITAILKAIAEKGGVCRDGKFFWTTPVPAIVPPVAQPQPLLPPVAAPADEMAAAVRALNRIAAGVEDLTAQVDRLCEILKERRNN